MKKYVTAKWAQIMGQVLILVPILILGLLVFHIVYIHQFNNTEHVQVGNVADALVSMEVDKRSDSTAGWLKRDFDYYGQFVNLNAMTYDGILTNKDSYEVSYWTLRMDITSDCFISNAWNGEMEIHQYVGTDREAVQRLDLSDVDRSSLTLQYLYDGENLYIPLEEGDYILYFPSAEDNEYPVKKGTHVSMGFILYYLDIPDVSSYTLTYQYHRSIFSGHMFITLMVFLALWAMTAIMYIAALVIVKRTRREMELKKSGIECMSDIYAIIHIVDLVKNEIVPVVADEDSEKLRPRELGADEQMRNLFELDAMDAYKTITLQFTDLHTLAQRMETRNSLVFEYVSRKYGWCRLRFFAMDRKPSLPLEKVLFTIQVINQEKEELAAISQRVEEAETESRTKSTFLANMSHEIRTPINTVIGLDTMILRESKEKGTRAYARDIRSAAQMLLSLINSILDFSKLEAGRMELVPVEYSLKKLLQDVRTMVTTRAEAKNLKLVFDIAPDIPDRLYGDDVRIKQVLINLLTNAVKYTEQGSVTVTITGRMQGESEKLHISVKDTGIGIRKEDRERLTERFARFDEERNHNIEGTGIGLNLVVGLISLMGSVLKIDSTYGEGSDFYFDLDQRIVDPEPIGFIDFAEVGEEEEEQDYAASFTAPEARILAVDDNSLNLVVIENLLKETKVQIDKATSGRQALEKTMSRKYDLIFMDHMMPDMDGIETFHRIQDQPGGLNQKTPVLVLTANALKGAEEEYAKEGFVDFISKPIQPELLEEKTRQYLDPVKVTLGGGETEVSMEEEQAELPVISGVDAAYGVDHIGDVETLLMVLKRFAEIAPRDAEELEGFFRALKADPGSEEGLKAYRIKVHAMKSSAMVFGAMYVGGTAAMLEYAARDGKVSEILAVHSYFLEEWLGLKQKIDGYFGVPDEK